ncbi:7-carboxy-7-deazaguanine synthase [Alkalihalobacillus alcalophilus ATCC 27647 = CGMCC 1.3604]|uniref:7-carboxy-7-deazaguanine synthase n=1 Tax=Alkalihalobacillus alcalophilus ATCC 27647 = CGMCC 1.3604 TaxID=1218173 RepID=A0A094WRV4_ALKAL|nr:7-carboxy-7-deazaguanine synthase QueE [Alkalihalobacillus alcalophilus]KGA98738.1 7-carboxy-7-deazaguanine synthase [Alkalihalobacillus alcalophilus ATCC 27647 = CGMCC 1.3604]MED1562351.1 7-carboxy-7-deazaguanine synthase QueE [Alkalihalobacillus alcalophilus]THG89433.1 7-carboxy-7-deazaguanine synthase [Alkalihalobacillus alcalophilus ATCC 27647 = CGMCC 1.3604]
MKKIPVMEIFGPTIQGEGMVIGQKTMFVRTSGCDYSCSWCDSAFTWDGTGKSTLMTAEAIVEQLQQIGGDNFSHVTISGGNPALHKGIAALVDLLKEKQIQTAIETQGSIWQDWLLDIDEVTISPKPPSSKMETNLEKLDEIIHKLSDRNISLKVVIFDDVDFDYAETIHKRYPDVPFYLQVGNEDAKTEENHNLLQQLLNRYEWLIERTIDSQVMNDAKVLPQLHTLLWGNKRGV